MTVWLLSLGMQCHSDFHVVAVPLIVSHERFIGGMQCYNAGLQHVSSYGIDRQRRGK